MSAERLPEDGPLQAIDRRHPIRLTVDGRAVEAFAGDTVGSAMAAARIEIVGRSFKYHRPRGLFCMAGACANCLVTIDDVPNLRACTTPVREGMRVRRQNGWPSVDRDLLRVLDRLSFLLPPGFYYKLGHRPRWAWPLVEPIVRRVAGLGRPPTAPDHAPRDRISLHADVVVVGAGPAGLAAAGEAARAGARTLVLEQEAEPGGELAIELGIVDVREPELAGLAGYRLAARLVDEAVRAGAEILVGTVTIGIFDGPVVAATDGQALYRVRARRVVLAPGAIEQPVVFAGNDLPGVMLSGAARRLLHRFRIRPGRRPVVFAASLHGHRIADELRAAGAEVTLVAPDPAAPPMPDVDVLPNTTVVAAAGRRRVEQVVVAPVDGGRRRSLPCDALVVAGPLAPATVLPAMAGAEIVFDPQVAAFLPGALPPELTVAGAAAGMTTVDSAIADGRLAGLTAALGGRPSIPDLDRRAVAGRRSLPPTRDAAGDGKRFVCLCMDVTDAEIRWAVAEGFDSMELLKRYTTVTMGPCQGKSCLLPSVRACARATGRDEASTGLTTARPPWTPVELGTFASDRLVPRKETPMHEAHSELGATFMWAGEWRRPLSYGSPEEEVRAVRDAAGVIDVSTLGKFVVRGPDALTFLERLYPVRLGDLEPGRLRYSVMCNDQGAILDDGTVCRLGDDEFFVTTTTGNAETVDRWMGWWATAWGLDVRILNVTGGYAAVGLAGPRAREILARLTEADVRNDALRYLRAAKIAVAGVPALVLRLGFVGELSFEIHVPSGFGRHLWDAVLEAGTGLGLRPFGIEAQRVLRLEKQHILVGQDTDAESDPYEVGLGWMVHLDKPDFLGRQALAELAARDPRERLVGFTADPAPVPPEGAAVVREGTWAGRVTSCRRSPTLGRVIGLAWVPADLARDGEVIEISFDGARVHATVHLPPFYDPEGLRVRS